MRKVEEKRSDADLLAAWRESDVAAGEALFARHFDAVHRFFCNKVWNDQIDDLIQETFLGCVRGRERFEVSFRTYLFGIARKQLLKHCDRWRQRHRNEDYQSSRVAALDASPSQLAAQRQEQKLLLRALRRLPLDLQTALELFYWEGMKSVEIAEVLDIPHGTARSRLRRGREILKETVETLADSPELLQSTVGDFDGWLRSIQAKVAGQGDAESQASDG